MYRVWFKNENYKKQFVEVYAFNSNEALILAQAERIKEGLDYTFHRIDILG